MDRLRRIGKAVDKSANDTLWFASGAVGAWHGRLKEKTAGGQVVHGALESVANYLFPTLYTERLDRDIDYYMKPKNWIEQGQLVDWYGHLADTSAFVRGLKTFARLAPRAALDITSNAVPLYLWLNGAATPLEAAATKYVLNVVFSFGELALHNLRRNFPKSEK